MAYTPNPQPWMPPTSIVLQAGESVQYSICFSLPPVVAVSAGLSVPPPSTVLDGGPRSRDAGLLAIGEPLLLPIPGPVIATDMSNASLFVVPPAGATLTSVETDVAAVLSASSPVTLPSGYIRVPLTGLSRGRARVTLNFSDGTSACAHYYVLPPLDTLVSAYSDFASSTSWLTRDTPDPFGRSASVMPYDREDDVFVLQDARPFIVGLSDDAGAGATLGFASKTMMTPTQLYVDRLDAYVNWTLQGVKPDTALPPLFSLQDPVTQRILMTVFYFDNPLLNTTNYYTETDKCTFYPSWCSFNSPFPGHPASWIAEYRQFNFPHQASVYMALYRAARNWPGITTLQPWQWYLNWAVNITAAMACYDANTGNYGCIPTVSLMDDTVFLFLLEALNDEGLTQQAAIIDGIMRTRVNGGSGIVGWVDQDYPAGSEFSWDTTGFEACGVWGAYYNATSPTYGSLADRIANYILAFMPTAPNWAFHGSALGAGDFSNNAKWMVTGGWEREGGHYRAGLNSIPLFDRYRANPDDLYLLLTGMGGITAVLPNINNDGATSMGFHTHPFIHEHDPNSGDYGLAFFGHTANAGSYLVNHTALGWLCFLCDASPTEGGGVTVTPRDSYHMRAFLEPLGLYFTAQTGTLAAVAWLPSNATIVVTFAASTPQPPLYSALRLVVQSTAATRAFAATLVWPAAPMERGAYAILPAPGGGTTQAVFQYQPTSR